MKSEHFDFVITRKLYLVAGFDLDPKQCATSGMSFLRDCYLVCIRRLTVQLVRARQCLQVLPRSCLEPLAQLFPRDTKSTNFKWS